MAIYLGLDIGSNSVGSAWIDTEKGSLTTGLSIFPAGVEESDEKRGDPKNVKRRTARRSRITLARRAARKRALRLKLIAAGLLPADSSEFQRLLESTDPWCLRSKGLDTALKPFEFGRVLLHLAQRRGALGLKLADSEDGESDNQEDGKVKAAIGEVLAKMLARKARTFGEFIAMVRAERVTPITTEDRRPADKRRGPREWRGAIRNKAASYEHCADRAMIRDEFKQLWDAQKHLGGPSAVLLTDELRQTLDEESNESIWRHKGLLFGQRKTYWDTGTLGRCVLEPTERCVPHADMYASRYLVVETVNNLKIIERGKEPRPLEREEREKIKAYLSGPLGMEKGRKKKGQSGSPAERPKTTVNVTDLRRQMEWGRATKTAQFRFNIENDEERNINTDWFSREIIHGAITPEKWATMSERVRDGVNRAILRHDPDQDADAARLKKNVMSEWAGLTEAQADKLVAAWKARPKLDAKRLNMSRRAVRNLLVVMDRTEPWPDPRRQGKTRWLTQIEARKIIAADDGFRDVTTGQPLDEQTRRRYATGAKGATACDRHYLKKHLLRKNGEPIYGPDGLPLAEPPPAPLISNPVVRKAIHEVRRHLVEYMTTFGRKPDGVYVELAREARMGKLDADRFLERNRLRSRIRQDIIQEFDLHIRSATQQRAAVDRVVLAAQQGCVCPLCGQRLAEGEDSGITLRMAAMGQGCEVAHIIPRADGGENGLSNIVLAHTKCNRDMGKRTPRQYWSEGAGFEKGLAWIGGIYGDIERPNRSEVRQATGQSLWLCYFTMRDDNIKIEQFKKDVKDLQEMTPRQEAATKYASRQVMAYLADAIYGGKGLPERSTAQGDEGGERRIFATDGMWTSRLRREWGLFFDPHESRANGLDAAETHVRKEKDRGDHRHHAIDAIVIALCTEQVRNAWDARERQADKAGVNTADAEAMENYRRNNRLPPPHPFKTPEELREAVRLAVFGERGVERPICHRPEKRKLNGALHKATQYGPVIETWKRDGVVYREAVEGRVTVRQQIIGEAPSDFLKPSHLRVPRLETNEEAVERLAHRFRIGKRGVSEGDAIKLARKLVKSKAFKAALISPKPEKGGIVRDGDLRRLLRRRLEERGLNPDAYTKGDLKRSIEKYGPLTHDSGVPIYSVVLLWANSDPVTIRRDHFDYHTGERRKLEDPGTHRLYDGQNNHHIEIRVANDKNGKEVWSGRIVSAFDISQQLTNRLRKLTKLEKPFRHLREKLTKEQRDGLSNEEIKELSERRLRKWKQAFRDLKPQRKAIIDAHSIIDRSDSEEGHFAMSLAEGETLFMKDKRTGEVGYFVVAKLDKPQTVVLVPHWDARAATGRKDAAGNKVSDSEREQFSVTPNGLKALAAPGHSHAIKVRVSPLGIVTILSRD